MSFPTVRVCVYESCGACQRNLNDLGACLDLDEFEERFVLRCTVCSHEIREATDNDIQDALHELLNEAKVLSIELRNRREWKVAR